MSNLRNKYMNIKGTFMYKSCFLKEPLERKTFIGTPPVLSVAEKLYNFFF